MTITKLKVNQKTTTMTNKVILQLTALLLLLSGCSPSATDKPTLKDYKIGEKWVWNWKRTVDGKVRAQGKDIKEVVNYHGELG